MLSRALNPRSLVPCSLMVLVSVLPSLVFSQDFCDEMGEFECAILVSAMQNWNNDMGKQVQIVGSEYVGPVDELTVENALKLITAPEMAWFPNQGPEGNIVEAKSLESIKEEELLLDSVLVPMEEAWRDDTVSFLKTANHVVQMEWQAADDTRFVTYLAVGEQYPFIYDTMLSNVFLTDESNSCENRKVFWLFGWTRGEIIVDIAPVWGGEAKVCKRMVRGWMSFGQIQHEINDVKYDANYCSFQYAYAFTSPMASASFDRNGFKFEVSGIGSYKTGEGDCIDSSERSE